MKLINLKLKSKRGYTLIELLIYTAMLVIISVVLVASFIQIVNVVETSRRNREALDNARVALDLINQEIRHAESVYTPTSVVDTSPGQLSLETTRDTPTDEESTYVDIYVDNQRLFIKRESQSDQIVTSEKVRITSLEFNLLNETATKSAVRTRLTIEYFDVTSGTPSSADSVTLTSTSTVRAYE